MAGKAKLAVGLIMLIIGGILLAGAAVSASTYFESLDVMESNKKARDAVKSIGGDTSDMDEKIRQDQALLDSKVTLMSVCSLVGIILLVIGFALLISYNRDRKKQQPSLYPQAAFYPPGQPNQLGPGAQYPGYQNPPPPQNPGY